VYQRSNTQVGQRVLLIHFIHGYYCIYRPWQPLAYLCFPYHCISLIYFSFTMIGMFLYAQIKYPSKCINDQTLRSDREFCRTSHRQMSDKCPTKLSDKCPTKLSDKCPTKLFDRELYKNCSVRVLSNYNIKYICTIYTHLDTCLMSISRFSLRERVRDFRITFALYAKKIFISWVC
jgi:dolichyl-phosphate-mannose--protein O-mannosyl transferase